VEAAPKGLRMRMIRFAAAALLLAGCFGPADRESGTGGTGGGSEPDVAVREEGGAGGGSGGAGQGGSSGEGGSAGAGGTGGTRPDAALPKDTGLPRDTTSADAATQARDARPDAPRDQGSASTEAAPPDAPAPDAAGGDPEPGRLAGITRLHNQVRATIPVPALTWDPTIAATAAAYAAKCMFEHSGTKGLGENLAAYAPPKGQKANAPVDDWAGEKADYDYASNSCTSGKDCGHYTQLVWKSSQRLGCAVQTCSQNSPFGASFPDWDLWVCEYAPPGNFVGQRPY
jgi:pathogenesis-related protein 1